MADPFRSLAEGFAPRGADDFEALLQEESAGASPSRLASPTADGILIDPLYLEGAFLCSGGRGSEEVEVLGIIGADGNGRIAEAIDHAMEHGAGGVLLQLSAPGRPGGLAAEPADWGSVLEAVTQGRLHLRPAADSMAHARAWLESAGLSDREGCSLGLDPFAQAARTGNFDDLAEDLAGAARLGAETLTHPARPRAFVLDSEPYVAAGATTAQAAGCLLGALVETLRALESANVDPARALPTVELCARLDARFFEQLSALRALRMMQRAVAESCGVEAPGPVHLSALPASRILSRRDPWVNMLRQTATSFAALAGTADAVGAYAFDCLLEHTSVTGRRVARNTPIILAQESRLGRVLDPAAGSWFLDHLTREIVRRSWEFFQQIEREGGLVRAMRSGWLLERLNQSHVDRRARIAHRQNPRTGVSEFARLDEQLPAPVTPLPSLPKGAWPRHGDDDEFERLRAASDRHAVSHRRPRVFLARIGDPARFAARETWLVHLAAAAGVDTIAGDPEGNPAKEFASSRATTAILCSDDATLREAGAGVARELGAIGRVWCAGKPVKALESAGVTQFVHQGRDVVEMLEDLVAAEGVES
jgi:methylmalonyl-CoA mutase